MLGPEFDSTFFLFEMYFDVLMRDFTKDFLILLFNFYCQDDDTCLCSNLIYVIALNLWNN